MRRIKNASVILRAERNKIMKKAIALILSFALIACALCACGNAEEFSEGERLSKKYTRSTDAAITYNYSDGEVSAPLSYTVYASSVTNFELRMFRNYYLQKQDKTKSSFFAPAQTALQLALLLNGASGNTKDEISAALGGDLTPEYINQCSSYFRSRMEAVSKIGGGEIDALSGEKNTAGESEFVKLQSGLFFNDTSDVKTSFLQKNADYFSNDIFRFVYSDKNSIAKVNKSFCDFSSENFINSLDENGCMFSVSASGISDLWLESYALSDVKNGVFKSDGEEKSASFMTSDEYKIKSDKARGVIKYTSKNPLKLMLVMPNEGIALDDYISDFNNLEFSNLLDSVDITKKVTAEIPQFSVKSEKNALPLSDILADSGLHTLFTDEAAFKNMTNADGFTLDEMYEITPDFTVNASGINSGKTVAKERSVKLEKTDETVLFNRPFIFLLIDNESSIPLYIGTVNNI